MVRTPPRPYSRLVFSLATFMQINNERSDGRSSRLTQITSVGHRLQISVSPAHTYPHNGRVARSGRLAAPFLRIWTSRAQFIRESIPFEDFKRLTLAKNLEHT